MVDDASEERSWRRASVSVAYRAENGLRDVLARAARRAGWTPAVLPYSGYGGPERARVLARVVLAPAGTDPAARRGIPGWQRLLTLECPGAAVDVEVGGVRESASSDAAGLVDVVLETALGPGTTKASVCVQGRDPVPANVHVAGPTAGVGLVCDIDDTVWITGLSHPFRAAWRTMRGTSSTRQTVPGMSQLLRRAVQGQDHAAVIYLSNGPWNLAGPVLQFLERHEFPTGALLMTDWGITPRRWFRDGRAHKAGALERLAEDLPWVRWVLVGDDGEHDPAIYEEFTRAHPARVAAIALRQVLPPPSSRQESDRVGEVPVVRGPDGEAMLARLDEVLGRSAADQA